MENLPHVSVIVPVYRGALTIRRCIESLIGQTYENYEIITINDASPDHSESILRELAEKHSRIKIVNKRVNEGVHAARLDGIRIAQGTYLAFADADDWCEPNMIESLCRQIPMTNADIVVAGSNLIDKNNRRIGLKTKFQFEEFTGPDAFRNFCLLQLGTAALWNKLIRRDLAVEFADQNWKWRPDAGEDTLMMIGCLSKAQKTITIPDIIYNYIQHDQSATAIAGNALSYARILRAYACAIEIYNHFNEDNKKLIDELYRRQLNMPVYHVYNPEDLDPHKALLEKAIEILAQNRPSALFEIANIGISCPRATALYKNNLNKIIWALHMALRPIRARFRKLSATPNQHNTSK